MMHPQSPSRSRLLLPALLIVAALLSPAAGARAEPQDEVAAVAKEWETAFSQHDIARILTLYSKDALLWGTTSPTLRNTPEGVRAFFEGAFRIPNITVKFDNQTIRVFGSVAVAAGNYTFTASQGSRTQTSAARYSFTLVNDGGKWLIVDHNSSLLPSR